ncbi:MAG TPA: hypothetical protein VK636_20080 [Gemmatimonadaceae bacterium]|nr:hypothetical protein [Gemmatimonadaceae bacterium]
MDIRLERSIRPGAALYGIGLIGFGIVGLVRLDAVPAIEPVSAAFPLRPLLAVVSAAVLIGAGGLLAAGRQTLRAAIGAASFLFFLLVSLHVPHLSAHPLNGGAWVGAFEVLAISSAGWLLAATIMLDQTADSPQSNLWRRVAVGARLAFSICLIAFGLSHFVYHQYVESVIPAWMPAHRFWTYGIAICFLAAGMSLATRIKPNLSATLLAIMFGSWVVLVHAPRTVGHSPNANEWTSLLVAVAMSGGSWIVSVCVAARNHDAANAGVAATGTHAKRHQLASS